MVPFLLALFFIFHANNILASGKTVTCAEKQLALLTGKDPNALENVESVNSIKKFRNKANPGLEAYERTSDRVIWNYTTSRKSSTIESAFSPTYGNTVKELNKVGLNPLNLKEIQHSNESVLSIGEGGSDFIYKIIKAREEAKFSTKEVIAIDIVYTNKGPFSYKDPSRAIDYTNSSKAIAKYLDQYPANYLNKEIEKLLITDKNGKKILFSEIISSNSLNYILEGVSLSKSNKIMKNLLSHTEVGGYIRVTPEIVKSVQDTALKNLIDSGEIVVLSINSTTVIKRVK